MTALDATSPAKGKPNELRTVLSALDAFLTAHDHRTESVAEFLGAQFDAGLAWVQFDQGSGGLGVDAGLNRVVRKRLAAAGAPDNFRSNPVAYGQAAGAVHLAGTPLQRERGLRRMFTCEDHWCQLFSEPGAGSDLAGLATAAVRDGDTWIVNGQKIWSSGAREADLAILVARTDPTVPKHAGITFFVVDMTWPGIEVRPIRELTGNAHFNEVFLTDVRIPDDYRIGAIGAGWRVSTGALAYERGLATEFLMKDDARRSLLAAWAEVPADRPGYAELRGRVVTMWMQARAIELLLARITEENIDGAMGKAAVGRFVQDSADLIFDLHGPSALLGVNYESAEYGGWTASDPTPYYELLRSRTSTIAGGTTEVMLNILGERTLGLPTEDRPDKRLPWNEVPRGQRREAEV
jgi:alkylation response protein AidB-like acyl-CoA dehydrogenase